MRLQIEHRIVDTYLATAHWQEAQQWDGRHMVSLATGNSRAHETLYRSKKGNYYVITVSAEWDPAFPAGRFLSESQAAEWLIKQDLPVPIELTHYLAKLVE